MSKKINLFLKGIVDVLPLLIPVVPFGVIVGAIGIELGFTPLETYATSLIIFGGASQIVFLQLFSGGASSIITISSTFVVNSRHLLYGASLSEYLNNLTIGWKLLLQPEDLEHDDKSNLKLEVVDRKFRGTNFIYTLKTQSNLLIPVFVHSHHVHQHEVDEKFGIKRPIHIDHIVCFD